MRYRQHKGPRAADRGTHGHIPQAVSEGDAGDHRDRLSPGEAAVLLRRAGGAHRAEAVPPAAALPFKCGDRKGIFLHRRSDAGRQCRSGGSAALPALSVGFIGPAARQQADGKGRDGAVRHLSRRSAGTAAVQRLSAVFPNPGRGRAAGGGGLCADAHRG